MCCITADFYATGGCVLYRIRIFYSIMAAVQFAVALVYTLWFVKHGRYSPRRS